MDDNTQKSVAVIAIALVTVAAFYFAGPGGAVATIFAAGIGLLAPSVIGKKE